MGFFRGLDAEAYDRSYRDRDLVRRMLAYFKPYRRRLIIAVVAILVIAGAGALSPIFVSRSVDLMVESHFVRPWRHCVGGKLGQTTLDHPLGWRCDAGAAS
jgi:ABC-type multidrug transport system fused ATPase/permease subunit